MYFLIFKLYHIVPIGWSKRAFKKKRHLNPLSKREFSNIRAIHFTGATHGELPVENPRWKSDIKALFLAKTTPLHDQQLVSKDYVTSTLPETNIFATENRPLEKEIPIGNHHFQVPC